MPNSFDVLGIAPGSTFEDIQAAYLARRAEAIAGQQPEETLRALDDAYHALLENKARAASEHTITQPIVPSSSLTATPIAAPVLYTPPSQPEQPVYNPTAVAAQAMYEQGAPPAAATITCPTCGLLNPAQLTTCQNCGSQISRTCPVCVSHIPIYAPICPRCGAATDEVAKNRALEANEVARQIDVQRLEDDARFERQEQRHATRAAYGVVFWMIVTAVLVGLCALASYAYWFTNQPR